MNDVTRTIVFFFIGMVGGFAAGRLRRAWERRRS